MALEYSTTLIHKYCQSQWSVHLISANRQQQTLGLKCGNGLMISSRFGLLSTATYSLRKKLSVSQLPLFLFL